jgi:methylmalonyl-CoA mutase
MKKVPKKSLDDWRSLASKECKGQSPEELAWKTPEGIAVKPLYTAEDLHGLAHLDSLPGLAPFVRGPRATMYAGRPWTVRQYAGFSTAEESNAFYRKNLEAGQTGLSVAFDLATHRGYDSDHPRVVGDVGKAGVAIDSIADMKILFDGIPLDEISVSMTMNGAALPIMAMYIAAKRHPQGIHGSQYLYLSARTVHADRVRYYCLHLCQHASFQSHFHIRLPHAGSRRDLCPGISVYDRRRHRVRTRGDRQWPRRGCLCSTPVVLFRHRHELLYGSGQTESRAPALVDAHGRDSLTAKSPYTNIMRTTIEAMAAAFGGTQSLHTNSFDEALALPTEFSARIARNTQLVLQEETGITKVVDPLAGSYYLESLTDELAKEARKLIDEVEEMGGMTRAVETGMPKMRIEESSVQRQARVDRGEETIVGVNKYQLEEEPSIDILNIDNAAVREAQIRRLKEVRSNRDEANCSKALDALTQAAEKETGNLLALAVDAARARATVGEISDALEKVYGRHRAVTHSIAGVYGAAYESDDQFASIRKEVVGFAEAEGRRPRMLVCKLGQDGHDRGAKVIATAFADIGFDVDIGPLFQTPEEAVREAIENDVHVIGISSQAAGHKTLVPQVIEGLKQEGADDIIVICGGVIPPQDYDEMFGCGVSAIFGPGTNILEAAHEVLGIVQKRRQKL